MNFTSHNFNSSHSLKDNTKNSIFELGKAFSRIQIIIVIK